MITEQQYKDAESLTGMEMYNLIETQSPGLLRQLLGIASIVPMESMHWACAFVMGAVFAEADIKGCEADQTGFVDLEQRLRMFCINVRVAHREAITRLNAANERKT